MTILWSIQSFVGRESQSELFCWRFSTKNEVYDDAYFFHIQPHNTCVPQVSLKFHNFPQIFVSAAKSESLLHTAIDRVLRKLTLSGGYSFKAVEALKQPCALSVSNSQTYLISSPHSAWTFSHLLHMDGCSRVKLSPNGTGALQCPGQSIWGEKTTEDISGSARFLWSWSPPSSRKNISFLKQ